MKLFVLFIISLVIVSAALSFITAPTETKQEAFIEATKVRLATVHDNQNQIATMLLSISDRLNNMKKTSTEMK